MRGGCAGANLHEEESGGCQSVARIKPSPVECVRRGQSLSGSCNEQRWILGSRLLRPQAHYEKLLVGPHRTACMTDDLDLWWWIT